MGERLNVAVQDFAAVIVTETVEFVPLQSPLQPEKVEPVDGDSVAVAVEL
jgi:hypothetical protein